MKFKELSYTVSKLLGPLLPDKVLQLARFYALNRVWPNLRNPQTLTDIMLARAMFDRDPRQSVLADKLAMREYILSKVPDARLPALYASGNRFDDINWAAMPDRFVIKGSHGSGMIYLVRDKSKMNMVEARAECEHWLKRDYYYYRRERSYKGLPRRLMVEEFLEGEQPGEPPADYKFFMGNGKMMMVICDVGRFIEHQRLIYDENWQKLPIVYKTKDAPTPIPRPPHFEAMIAQAKIFAADFEFLRVDFYVIGDKFYVGELTYHPDGGNMSVKPPEWDLKLGQAYGPVFGKKAAG